MQPSGNRVHDLFPFLSLLILCAAFPVLQTVLSSFGLASSITSILRANAETSYFWGAGFAALIAWPLLFSATLGERVKIAATGTAAFLLGEGLQALGAFAAFPMLSLETLGLTGLAALTFQCIKQKKLSRVPVALCFVVLTALSDVLLPATYYAHPQTLDLYPYYFDNELRLRIAPFLYFVTMHSSLLSAICAASYVALIAGYQILAALQIKHADETRASAIFIFALAGLLGSLIYFLLPVAGPRYLLGPVYLGHLPYLPFEALHPVAVIPAPRNGMPSLHATWAILLLLNVPRICRTWRIIFAVYLLLIFISTMGLGEHYLCDLVAALPFSILVQSLALWVKSRSDYRFLGTAFRSALAFATLLWLVFYTPFGPLTPLTAWLAVIAVTLYSLIELKGLQREQPARPVNDLIPTLH